MQIHLNEPASLTIQSQPHDTNNKCHISSNVFHASTYGSRKNQFAGIGMHIERLHENKMQRNIDHSIILNPMHVNPSHTLKMKGFIGKSTDVNYVELITVKIITIFKLS